MLREHRKAMRVMEQLLEEEGLDEELDDRMMYYTGNTTVFLGHCDIRDETSDCEDPEATLRDELATARQELAAARQELAEKSAFVEAVSGALQCNRVSLDLERRSMMLEDVLSQQLR